MSQLYHVIRKFFFPRKYWTQAEIDEINTEADRLYKLLNDIED